MKHITKKMFMLIKSNTFLLFLTQCGDYWAAGNKLCKPEPNFSFIWHQVSGGNNNPDLEIGNSFFKEASSDGLDHRAENNTLKIIHS